MQRTIIGFHQDATQEWVADLECGHQQHVRHPPPWLRPSGSFRLKAVAVAQGAGTLLVAPWRHGGVDVVSRVCFRSGHRVPQSPACRFGNSAISPSPRRSLLESTARDRRAAQFGPLGATTSSPSLSLSSTLASFSLRQPGPPARAPSDTSAPSPTVSTSARSVSVGRSLRERTAAGAEASHT